MAIQNRNKKDKKHKLNYSQDQRNIQSLDFSWSSPRQTTNFGWGMSSREEFVTTEDVRIRLDEALRKNAVKDIRVLSQHFFKTSGVYARVVRYLANMPTYDYLVMPRVLGMDVDEKTITREVINQLTFLETLKLKTALRQIALDVIVDGVSFVYLRRKGSKGTIQKLPTNYCRTTGFYDGFPNVEFNLDYFDRFTGTEKIQMLNSFPPEIVYEYNKYKQDTKNGGNTSKKRLNQTGDILGGTTGTWITLDSDYAACFYFNPSLQPLLSNALFAILDVLELKGIEKKKAENELYNLVIQQFPLNDDGEPIFDLVEMEAFHKGARKVFENTNQTDLLTTFADVKNINLNEAAAAPIDFTGWTKDVYSEMGVSQQLFSTEGNMALEKSEGVDASLMFSLVDKFQDWVNLQLDVHFNRDKKHELFYTRLQILPTTMSNRKEMASIYKDLGTLGYSKFYPAVALGQSQLDLMSTIVFENNILGLGNAMEPLKSSHTTAGGEKGGRPSLPDSQKSDKTIANNESM